MPRKRRFRCDSRHSARDSWVVGSGVECPPGQFHLGTTVSAEKQSSEAASGRPASKEHALAVIRSVRRTPLRPTECSDDPTPVGVSPATAVRTSRLVRRVRATPGRRRRGRCTTTSRTLDAPSPSATIIRASSSRSCHGFERVGIRGPAAPLARAKTASLVSVAVDAHPVEGRVAAVGAPREIARSRRRSHDADHRCHVRVDHPEPLRCRRSRPLRHRRKHGSSHRPGGVGGHDRPANESTRPCSRRAAAWSRSSIGRCSPITPVEFTSTASGIELAATADRTGPRPRCGWSHWA